ncbi:hypothetical protein PsYK624_072030 [Phanerochaete sordida]|uniref:AB hydrolase-1 domain-containing protein n=1 Tax=Phanerochaete sordida TaxID=48140 RepID=A0A9P3GAK6_9APHY|nr:hypothetical protein PsYK624_072030 [Phanerochaete sordida]
MLPVASTHGLRIITMNGRDYRGSTPYTDEELADMTSPGVDVQASAVRRWGREVALFLAYICQTLRIPAATTVDTGTKAGGLVFIAWSLSGMAILSMLGDPQTLGKELPHTLTPYLRKIVLYDSPCIIYGIVPEIGLRSPHADPNIPTEKQADAAADWLSSYYPPLAEDQPITAEALQAHSTALPRTPTLRTLSSDKFKRTVDMQVSSRALLIMGTDEGIRKRHARVAFFDADAVLPDVDILALSCDQSAWLNTWGAKVFLDMAEEAAERGKRKRRAAFLRVRNANHFVHWDEPERMVRLFAEHCCSSTSASVMCASVE